MNKATTSDVRDTKGNTSAHCGGDDNGNRLSGSSIALSRCTAAGNSSLVASESQTTNCLGSLLAASGQLQHGDASAEFMGRGLWASQSFRVPEPAGVLPQTPSTASLQHDIPRGGVVEPFPWKLHRMLEETQLAGKGHIASYFAHGRAFAIHKPKVFVREIMPLYFRQSKMTSLNRQLNLYGFQRINSGPDKGGYYHDLFLQGRPQLCAKMRRTKIKGTSRGNDNRSDCPDFYAYPVLRADGCVGPTSSDLGSISPPLSSSGYGVMNTFYAGLNQALTIASGNVSSQPEARDEDQPTTTAV